MSKKEFKKKNIKLNENDLQNVSGGIIVLASENPDGTYSPNVGDTSLKFATHKQACEYAKPFAKSNVYDMPPIGLGTIPTGSHKKK